MGLVMRKRKKIGEREQKVMGKEEEEEDDGENDGEKNGNTGRREENDEEKEGNKGKIKEIDGIIMEERKGKRKVVGRRMGQRN